MPEITDEEFAELKQYRQVGTLKDLQQGTFERAATLAGFNPAPLKRLFLTLPQDQFSLVFDAEGNPAVKEGQLEPVSLTEFAEQEWNDFLPSLKKSGGERTIQSVPYVRQAGEQRETNARSASKKLADNYIMSKYGSALKSETVN